MAGGCDCVLAPANWEKCEHKWMGRMGERYEQVMVGMTLQSLLIKQNGAYEHILHGSLSGASGLGRYACRFEG